MCKAVNSVKANEIIMKYRVVLASGSPRRKQIMEEAGFEFEICPATKDEVTTKVTPDEICVELAVQKAMEIATGIKAYNDEHPEITVPQDILVIGADTIVAVTDENGKNEILGKPKDEEDAKRMLISLSGNTHSVFTGVSFVFISKEGKAYEYSFHEETKVTFYEMSTEDIEAYIATGEPLDKAGAYGIQGKAGKYVKSIDGEFYNVVGLPIARVCYELKKLGVSIN